MGLTIEQPDQSSHLSGGFTLPIMETATLLREPISAIHSLRAEMVISRHNNNSG